MLHARVQTGVSGSARASVPRRLITTRSVPERSQATGQASGSDTQERISQATRDILPKLLNEQEEAAKSSGEINGLVRWASDLGSKAQQALAGLQRSIQSFPENPKPEGAAAAAEADIKDTIAKLEGVTASIADSNARFAEAFAEAGGAAAAAAIPAGGDAAEKVKSREAYLEGVVEKLEAAEEELIKKAADDAAAASKAAAEAAEAVAEAASAAAAGAVAAVEEAVEEVAAAVEKAAAPAGTIKVELAVHRETHPGQDVWVVGSIPALGAWSLDSALPLAWTEGHVWRATIDVDPSEAPTVEYKAVLKNGDGSVTWEGGDNHTADVSAAPAEASFFTEFVE